MTRSFGPFVITLRRCKHTYGYPTHMFASVSILAQDCGWDVVGTWLGLYRDVDATLGRSDAIIQT